MSPIRICGLLAATLSLAGAVSAQTIVPPPPGERPDVGCLVQGINHARDGYLKLRTGPSTGFEVIGALKNGDAAFVAAPCQGRWCYVENGVVDGREVRFRGWIYDGWCQFYP